MNATALTTPGTAQLPQRAVPRARRCAGRWLRDGAGYLSVHLHDLADIFEDLEWKCATVARGESPATITAARRAYSDALEAWELQIPRDHRCPATDGAGSFHRFARGHVIIPETWVPVMKCSGCGKEWEFDETAA
jgi:hypothetical protein